MTDTSRLSHLAPAAGRGFLLSFGFNAGIQVLVLVQSVLVPRLLGPDSLGLFALAAAGVAVGQSLRELGVDERLMQDQETDLPLAYSVAFTIEVALSTVLFLLVVALGPVVAHIYDRPELTLLIAVLAFTIYTNAFLNLPSALFLRDLRYGRSNFIRAVGPLVNFIVTVGLAFAGAGVWALVAGAVAALVASAAVVLWGAPLRPRLRFDGRVVRRFYAYGWPLWLASVIGLASTWGGSLVISGVLGIGALGFFSVAQSLAKRAFQLDAVLADAVFPVLCRARNDARGQRNAFVATNRLTVAWATVIGLGLVLFSEDLVHFVLGAQWEPAVFLFQMHGITVALGSVGFSWDIFFRAQGRTRPTLIFHVVSEMWVFVVLLPAVVLWDLNGAAWAVGTLGAVALVVRQAFIRRIFPGLNLLATAWRESVAVSLAAAIIAALRQVVWEPTNLIAAILQASLFVALAAALLFAVDHAFLAELRARLRSAPLAPVSPPDVTVVDTPIGSGIDTAVDQAVGALVEHPAPVAPPREFDSIDLPGRFPLYATAHEDALWITCRDSSQLLHFDTATRACTVTRLPAWPHVVGVDGEGTAWVALTLSGSVASVNRDRRVTRTRLARSRELLVAAGREHGCYIVDAGNRRLWDVDHKGASWRPLPDGMVRPDFVICAPDGAAWVTDTEQPVVARLSDGAVDLIEVPGACRAAVHEPSGDGLWLGHSARKAVTRLDTTISVRRRMQTFDLPAVPFGVALAPNGTVWVAFPDLDAIAALEPTTGAVRLIELAAESRPMSVAWCAERIWVTCASTNRLICIEP